jgi:hypothetical protein
MRCRRWPGRRDVRDKKRRCRVNDLISRSTRGLFRDLMTGSTVGEIGAAFQDELFAPSTTCTYQDSSVRRTLTQEYLEAVNWSDVNHITRVLRVFERLVHGFESSTAAGSSTRCAAMATSSMRTPAISPPSGRGSQWSR